MKRGLLIALGAAAGMIWICVLAALLWSPFTSSHAVDDHEKQMKDTNSYKSVDEHQLTKHFQKTEGNSSKTPSMLGKNSLSKEWIEDVSKDGKLSIDTLLKELELEDYVSDRR